MRDKENETVKCDTCGRETDRVARVVIEKGYNRASAPPVYNCPDCFARKNAWRAASRDMKS